MGGVDIGAPPLAVGWAALAVGGVLAVLLGRRNRRRGPARLRLRLLSALVELGSFGVFAWAVSKSPEVGLAVGVVCSLGFELLRLLVDATMTGLERRILRQRRRR
jgi:hypothetical protein